MALSPLPAFLAASSVVFPATDAVGTTHRCLQTIRNSEPVGVLIDRIAFGVGNSGGGAGVSVELRWRNEPITNGFARIGAITYPLSRANEDAQAGYVVKFAKPFYLPPGENIDVAFRLDYVNTNAMLGFAPMAIGLQAEPPAERWIPYLTSFTGASQQAQSGAAIADRSTPADLGNPFDVPLFVERMVGRVLGATAGAPGNWLDLTPGTAWNDFLVRIYDHHEAPWVPTPTPFPLVFSAVDRSWLMNTTMEPKGFLQVTTEGTCVSAAFNAAFPGLLPVVGLMGYRRIA